MLPDPLVMRGGCRAEERNPPAANVAERPRAQNGPDDRDAGPRELAELPRESLVIDAVLGHRHDHEICQERAVRIEISGRDRVILMRADDEDAAFGRDRRQRGATPVEHDQVGIEILRDPRACEDVRDADGAGETAAATPAADRRQPGECRRLEVVGGCVTPRAREREQVGHGRPNFDDLRRGRPPRPIATTTTRLSCAITRATWPVTAVLPTRLPVPITATDGVLIASKRGGSSLKSAPSYGTPSASARAASRNRAGGPSTGSSERSSTTSGAYSRIASSSEAASGTPYCSPPRSFSVPPTRTQATISCGRSTRASLTTEA